MEEGLKFIDYVENYKEIKLISKGNDKTLWHGVKILKIRNGKEKRLMNTKTTFESDEIFII